MIIYSHGFFSPLERDFLKLLYLKLSGQQVTYLHSSDLDYGGVRIFQYIKNRIFPECKPFKMNVEIFDEYITFSEKMDKPMVEKLKKIKEPLLQELIDRMIETEMVIEQEAFL